MPLLPLGPSPCPLLPPSSCPPETLALRPARRPPRGLLLGAPCSWCCSQRWPKPTPSDVPTRPQSTTSRTATCPQPSKCRGVSLTCQRHPGSRSPRPPGRQGTRQGPARVHLAAVVQSGPRRPGRCLARDRVAGREPARPGWSGTSPQSADTSPRPRPSALGLGQRAPHSTSVMTWFLIPRRVALSVQGWGRQGRVGARPPPGDPLLPRQPTTPGSRHHAHSPGAQGGSRGCWRHEAAASPQDGLPAGLRQAGRDRAGRVNTDRRPACLKARRGRGEAPGQPRLGCPQGLGQLRLPPSPGQSTHSLTTQLSSRLWPPGLCPPTIKCTPTTVTTPADAPDLQGFPGQRPLKWEPRAGVTQS